MKKVTSRDGTEIAFDGAGAGPALILVDGALCSRSFGPSGPLAALLSQHFTVIRYDRRGRGDSDDTAPYAVAREVEDLAALIQAAGGLACVVGFSSGAALALEAAASGLNITKVALYEPPFVAEGNPERTPDHQAELRRLLADGRRGDAVKYFMRDMVGIPGIFVFIMGLMPMWSKLKAVAHTLPYDAAILGDWRCPVERARSIKIPTLVMDGEKTDARLHRAVDATAAAIPHARRLTLAGQTHNVSAKAITPVLVEYFLGSAPASASGVPSAPRFSESPP